MKQERDRLFARKLPSVPHFSFDENVAKVFPDMARRSIPFYEPVQEMITELALDWYRPGTRIYDLGCATGRTLVELHRGFASMEQEAEMVGVDNSASMLERTQKNLHALSIQGVELIQSRLEDLSLERPSVVILNYTLQFVDPLVRQGVLSKIYEALEKPGILLISEKTRQRDSNISRFFQDAYYDFKRQQGYSELEIAQKREALEQVLIPYTRRELENMFQSAGFADSEPFFSWFNFTSWVCVKSETVP